MNKAQSYALGVGELSEQRYEILNHLYSPLTLDFLQVSCVKNNIKMLEVGCGTGLGTCEIAEFIGNQGQIVAIDASKDQLKIAEKNANLRKIKNIKFVELFAENLEQLNTKFDLVYARFILNTLSDPEGVINQMFKVLETGGLLICEEPHSTRNFFCYPPAEVYNKWEDMFLKLYNASGKGFSFDFMVGQKLYGWLNKLKIEIKSARVVQPLLVTPYEKRQLTLQMIELKPVLIRTGLATEVELNQFIHELECFEKDSSHVAGFFPSLQISGIKTQLDA